MDKIGASTLLRIDPVASDAEVEAAYRKRREEVRKHFEAARDRNTRTRCEREYFALEQARNLLLAETDDLVQEREELPANRAAASIEHREPVGGEEPLIERAAASVEHQEPAAGREAPLVEREESLVEPAATSIELESASVVRQECIDRGNLSERISPSIERVSEPIERVSPPIEGLSLPIRLVSPPKERERSPLQAAWTQVRTRFSQKQLAITGVAFFVVSAAAIILLLSHTPVRPKPGKLVLNTVPENARVWLDGVFRGKTPLVLEDVAPGDRRLKIGLAEYETEELIVSVKPGDEGSTRIVQLVPMRQPSPKPTARQSPTSRPEPAIVPAVIAPSGTPSSYPGERYPQTRERILTEAEVASLDNAELRYAINEMYARYGAPFLTQPDVERQFRAFPWYHPVHDLKLAQIEAFLFSAIEKRNVDILAGLRDQKRPK